MRLTSLQDATGRLTTFAYHLTAFPLLITQVTDPFGRSAKLTYTSDGHLSSITDVIGHTSSFTYDPSFEVSSLTTPYGTTNFTYFTDTRYVKFNLFIKDPRGYTEAQQFLQSAPGIPLMGPASEVPTGNIITRNVYLFDGASFHWDKHEYAVASGVFTMARQKNFCTHERAFRTLRRCLAPQRPLSRHSSSRWRYGPGTTIPVKAKPRITPRRRRARWTL